MREYAEAVAKKINEENDSLEAEVVEVVKVNDESNIGIKLNEKASNMGSIHYMDEFFGHGMSVKGCAREITERAKRASEMSTADLKAIAEPTWDDIKDCITMRLVNVEYNAKYLADKVHKNLGNGFAIMFDINKGEYRTAITDTLAKNLGCDELMLVCASQASNVGTPALYDLAERMLTDKPRNWLKGHRTANTSMMVLTDEDIEFGASVIYKGGIGDRVKEIVGDYYLLPSSVHEWIVVPESAGISAEELRILVKGANEVVVERRDLLSYGVYKWSDKGVKRVA